MQKNKLGKQQKHSTGNWQPETRNHNECLNFFGIK